MTGSKNEGPRTSAPARPRFYKTVTIAEVVPSPIVPEARLRHDVGEGQGGGDSRTSTVGIPPTPNPSPQGGGEAFRLLLDGKPVRTPAKKYLVLPARGLAEAIAAEWENQKVRIDPTTMPLTRLANSAIDGVTGREPEVRADIAKYAGSDLICYRAERPEALAERQAGAWDPILDWAAADLGARLLPAASIMPVTQPEAAIARVAEAVEALNAFQLTGLHVATTLMGSAVLALSVLRGRLSPLEAWAAAHIDEDYQIEQWGADAEAEARRAHRWSEMQAACLMMREG